MTNFTRTVAYKVLTHDLRPPVVGGDPICDGSLPFTLPPVDVDQTDELCGAGWNACRDGATALRIAGMWATGRPTRLFRLQTDAPVVSRGNKLRASTWDIVEEVEVGPHARRLIEPWAGAHTDEIHAEQMAWREALARPGRDEVAVEDGLRTALEARGLASWDLVRFGSAKDARNAWAAWDAWDATATRPAKDARDAWAAKEVRDLWDAWDARAAWDAWDAMGARDAWGAEAPRAAKDASNAWGARAAWDAMPYFSAVRMGWLARDDAHRLTVGLRDAYRHGLAIAVPVEGGLGWAMAAAS